MNPLLLIQDGAAAMPELTSLAEPVVEEVVQKISFFQMALKGGWIMIPLVLLLCLAIYIFIERCIALSQAKKEDPNFMNRIKDYIHSGNIESAIKLCKQTNTPAARMVEKGISRIGHPMNDVQVAIENLGNIEVARLEKGLPLLAAVSGGAPMIGFLGTVLGMVRAFYDMASAGNNVDITLLSSGIYTAMVTTVAGLIVGILAYFAYNYLVSRVNSVVNKMESRTMEFLDLLNEPAL
ncbi:MAG: MotA/TolQ/ExbB proton channel family protein [Bacteroidales bacterium]|nr:MotA/TolQ/ExbB proton channel family protein [Bacteroidales bacterium]MBO5718707.1 MotA/TolQ/ExbB proton channel family protein [Bacteroidales bacterium]MBO5769100.1 MotA/TolQ/ExbB proton channel family protein [Bacteroidales bacterium]MBO5819894.1 MotA/TolQ/ExbB proton channel family protein [Bacteroidales bacterium]MBO5835223.1 MotA/TolQ/ExbB proton channel family protein [Bacteroidales bacterium]